MTNRREAKLVKNPKFRLPKVKFDGKYFRKRMKEVRRSPSRNGA